MRADGRVLAAPAAVSDRPEYETLMGPLLCLI